MILLDDIQRFMIGELVSRFSPERRGFWWKRGVLDSTITCFDFCQPLIAWSKIFRWLSWHPIIHSIPCLSGAGRGGENVDFSSCRCKPCACRVGREDLAQAHWSPVGTLGRNTGRQNRDWGLEFARDPFLESHDAPGFWEEVERQDCSGKAAMCWSRCIQHHHQFIWCQRRAFCRTCCACLLWLESDQWWPKGHSC